MTITATETHAPKKTERLALKLLYADSEKEVVEILTRAGYWDRRDCWRLYGDKEGNFAQAGNQQSLPEAALVEKIVNSTDARLLAECHTRGIDPESDEAPISIRDAVALFFEGRRVKDDEAGVLVNWPTAKRTGESRMITVAATGDRPTRGRRTRKMCLTVADQGEGQSPNRLPETILSLNAKNKQRIRFVQGKFNMGGSGALRFCGKLGLQLIISRRHPALAKAELAHDTSANRWAITVVRREEPSNKSGDPIHSEFTYLAPIGAGTSPRHGQVLSFESESLPIMPEHDEPYKREVEWGTAIKLYEYDTDVGQSNILLPDGLLYSIERLLPEISLPIRLHECRGYKGAKERSFETTVSGLVVRLEDGRGDNLEDGFPLSVKLQAEGMRMTARIYAFKEKRAGTYLKNEGVIFTINGQAHGYLPKSIFSRPKAVGLQRLRDSLLVLVDCSSLTSVQREDLFMSSRDRLSKRPIRGKLEREIEEMLRNSAELRRLQVKRKEEDVESKLSEERPLEQVLGRVFRASPTLKSLFLQGQRLARPFPSGGGDLDGRRSGSQPGRSAFLGKRHPTYFKTVNCNYGEVFERNCEIGRRCRIKFETDVENGYFDRPTDRGRFELEIVESSNGLAEPSFSLTLEDGEAHLNMALPTDVVENETFLLQASVDDPILAEPFVNLIRLRVLPRHKHSKPSKKTRESNLGSGSGERQTQQGIALPHVITVREGDELWEKYDFTPESACYVISEPTSIDDEEQLEHTFYVNADNISLKTEMKYSKQDPRLLEAKFKYGLVLLGVAMLHEAYGRNGHAPGPSADPEPREGNNREEDDVQDRISDVSRTVAPVLIPIIDQLSGLTEDDFEELSILGDDD